eukprot:2709342-Pyramimonas_sp.AAC.1
MVGVHDRQHDTTCKEMIRMWASEVGKAASDAPMHSVMTSEEYVKQINDTWTALKVVPVKPNLRWSKHLLSSGPSAKTAQYFRSCFDAGEPERVVANASQFCAPTRPKGSTMFAGPPAIVIIASLDASHHLKIACREAGQVCMGEGVGSV